MTRRTSFHDLKIGPVCLCSIAAVRKGIRADSAGVALHDGIANDVALMLCCYQSKSPKRVDISTFLMPSSPKRTSTVKAQCRTITACSWPDTVNVA